MDRPFGLAIKTLSVTILFLTGVIGFLSVYDKPISPAIVTVITAAITGLGFLMVPVPSPRQ